jgi:hypothetical protein
MSESEEYDFDQLLEREPEPQQQQDDDNMVMQKKPKRPISEKQKAARQANAKKAGQKKLEKKASQFQFSDDSDDEELIIKPQRMHPARQQGAAKAPSKSKEMEAIDLLTRQMAIMTKNFNKSKQTTINVNAAPAPQQNPKAEEIKKSLTRWS